MYTEKLKYYYQFSDINLVLKFHQQLFTGEVSIKCYHLVSQATVLVTVIVYCSDIIQKGLKFYKQYKIPKDLWIKRYM